MDGVKILAKGSFLPKDIEINISTSNLKLNENIEERIKEIWEEKVIDPRIV